MTDFPKSLEEARTNFTEEDLVKLYQEAVTMWYNEVQVNGPKNRYDQICNDLGNYIALYNERVDV